ncbi:MAG: C69 family dipeptidase [Atribacterota bacterium]|nr:C69 family dipeptidase [Atribacterota bacterium]MDD4895627.1 C69 family dipeptidase [Atribacterota bacterium]MDD5638186.1 C69 family dipeptidase [Atribacterota bacterium]
MIFKFRILIEISSILLFMILIKRSVFCCTNMNMGKNASADGSVMNMGSQEGEFNPNIIIITGKKFEQGSIAPVYLNRFQDGAPHSVPVIKVGEIPQVERTYTYFQSCFSFMNEHQVFISDELLVGKPELENPNGIMDSDQLMVFALQRAKTAREAIMVAGKLAEKYGYSSNYGGPEAWSVGDPNEVWWFEIFGGGADWTPDSGRPGAVWVAQRVPDDHVSFNCNRSRIGKINLNDYDYFMGSSNIYTLAEEMGWWDPHSGEPFIWYEVYADGKALFVSNPDPEIELREWRLVSLVAPSMEPDPNQKRWPFSIKPDKKLSVQDIMAIQKDVYKGTVFDLTEGPLAGHWGSPDRFSMSSVHRAISHWSTTYHLIVQTRNWLPDPIGGLMWFGWDKAATSVQMPIYCGITELPDRFNNQSREIFHRDSAYWAFNFVSNWANLNYEYMIRDITEAREYLMYDMFTLQPAIEATALELYEKDPSLAIRFLTNYSVNTANKVVDYWWDLSNRLIAKYVDGAAVGEPSPKYSDSWQKADKEFQEGKK